ncbi:MAG: hypothetical protein NXI04_13115 [Planctomycetaceae bacterium]|nr:hypothetical protein [Planctomycetaceae bacterium]
MDSEKTEDAKSIPERRRWRRAVVATSVLGGMLFSGTVILPTALMKTSYRDAFLNEKLADSGLTIRSETGSGSWLTPLTLQNVELKDAAGHVHLKVKSIELGKSLFSMMLDSDLGRIVIVQPDLTIALDENGNLPLQAVETEEEGDEDENKSSVDWDLEFEVQNAAFSLSVPWRRLPIVDVVDVDVEGAVTTSQEGRFLTVEPIQIFDHEPLSQAQSEQNLALIAPVLSQSTALEGEVSVRVDGSTIRLDQDPVSVFPIRGTAVFHTVSARLKDEWAIQVAQMLKRPIARGVPNRLEIARDSAVAFLVDDVGIHHKGLGFLLPEISTGMVIESSGMVGLDESLDLALSLQLPQLIPKNPFTAALSNLVSAPFQLTVTGTVSEPKLNTPPGFDMVDQLSRNANPYNYAPEAKPVSDSVMDLISGAASPNPQQAQQDLPGNVLELIRSIRKARENAPPNPKKEERRQRRLRRRGLPVEPSEGPAFDAPDAPDTVEQ